MIPTGCRNHNEAVLPYMKQLDGLRAFAVLGVLWTHYVPQERWLLGMNLGEFGVRLFFVLSGFLITSLLMDARGRILREEQTLFAALRQFYLRRFLRIFPLFYATLGVAFVLAIPSARPSYGTSCICLISTWLKPEPGLERSRIFGLSRSKSSSTWHGRGSSLLCLSVFCARQS